MILSPVTQKRSPWVWIQYSVNGAPKKWHKTTVRKQDPKKLSPKAAEEYKLAISLEMNSLEGLLLQQLQESGDEATESGRWGWVDGWLSAKYRGKAATLKVYVAQWKSVLIFLIEHDILGPELVRREHGFRYIDWRTSQVKPKSGKIIKLSTALGEVKLLQMVMGEALERFHLRENPLLRLGIEDDDPELKPEYSEEEIPKIYEALDREAAREDVDREWMRRQFHIALNTGLRRKDTRIHRDHVRWRDDYILIEKPKGGRKKEFGIPIYSSIRPMIEKWYYHEKSPYLWTCTKEENQISGLIWHKFFHETISMPHLAFKCTRITFITDGLRRKIPENVMLKMVNHASKLINRLYQRWTSDDVRHYAELLPVRHDSSANSRSPDSK